GAFVAPALSGGAAHEDAAFFGRRAAISANAAGSQPGPGEEGSIRDRRRDNPGGPGYFGAAGNTARASAEECNRSWMRVSRKEAGVGEICRSSGPSGGAA